MLSNYTFICVQPYDFYFTWQIEVIVTNFRKYNLSHLMHILVWWPDQGKVMNRPLWDKLKEKYPEVSFFYYSDSGNTDLKLYIPLLRPDALQQHFALYPELSSKTIFYHDCDILFNYLPNFQKLGEDDINWESDTSSYLDYNYLRSKEIQGNIPQDEAIQILADIGNITIDVIKSYTGKTGGAQYILKGIDGNFWKDVKRIAYHIRGCFMHGSLCEGNPSINTKYFSSEAAGFQSWCADMWAVNFALWSRGKVTDITPELSFSWATDSLQTCLSKPIYHNAGVTAQSEGLFFKAKWQNKSPIGKNHAVKADSASYFYVQAIKEVGK